MSASNSASCSSEKVVRVGVAEDMVPPGRRARHGRAPGRRCRPASPSWAGTASSCAGDGRSADHLNGTTRPSCGPGSIACMPSALPGIRALAGYRSAWLSKDVVAGLVLVTLLVPQGMAYAELAGLPPITGLYTSILCLLGYAVFGPSRILVLGPDSSLGPMIAATVLPLLGARGDPARAIELASALAILVGAFMVLGGLLRLRFVAHPLSKPTMIGHMNGLPPPILLGPPPEPFGLS